MRPAYPVEEIRAAEQAAMAALPDGALMQRAATALARRCAALLGATYGARVVLLVGKGDNGGDALYAGALLAQRGARVDAVLVADRAHDGGLAALREAGGWVHGRDDAEPLLAQADLVVDGVLGIGGTGGLREPADRLAAATARSAATVVAVDVPSGVDASTGRVDGPAIRADVTVTFGALKAGLLVSPGAQHAGQVECADIGLDPPAASLAAVDADDVAALLPLPQGESTKYRRGVVGVAAGSAAYGGAAVLAVGAAVRAGPGMVRYAGPQRAVEAVLARWPEVIATVADRDPVASAGRVQAWVVGPGLGIDDRAADSLGAVLATDLPALVDADGLNLLADGRLDLLRERRAATLLTPHAGELARLTGAGRDDIEADRLTHARRAAADLGATVLLKGATTVIASPDGAVRVSRTGPPWLATAGAGDVLSGACGALLAGGLAPLDAAMCGAFLHGLAAGLAAGTPGAPITAYDVIDHWPAAVRAVLQGAAAHG